jgi:hypothetical protein
MPEVPAARCRLAAGPWWLLVNGPIEPSVRHSHRAAQIVVHGGAPCVAVGRGVRPGPIVVVPPDVPHAVVDHRGRALVLYVSPVSLAGRQLAAGRFVDGGSLDPVDPVTDLLGALRMTNWSHADEAARRTLEHLEVAEAEQWREWRRHRALDEALLGFPDDIALESIDVARLADDVGLSVVRITETLTGGLGVPLGGYVSWLRIVTAIEALVDGAELESAAAVARFPSVGELVRACTSMFGHDLAARAQSGNWLSAP